VLEYRRFCFDVLGLVCVMSIAQLTPKCEVCIRSSIHAVRITKGIVSRSCLDCCLGFVRIWIIWFLDTACGLLVREALLCFWG